MGTVPQEQPQRAASDRFSIWSSASSAEGSMSYAPVSAASTTARSLPYSPLSAGAMKIKHHKFYIDSALDEPAFYYQSQTPSWFFASTSRNSAEVILTRGKKYGHILLRESTTFSGNYVISARYDYGNSIEICHYEVETERTSDGDIEFRLKVGPRQHPSQPSLTDLLIYFMKLNPGLIPLVTNNWETIGIKSPETAYCSHRAGQYMTTNAGKSQIGTESDLGDYELIQEGGIKATNGITVPTTLGATSRTSSKTSTRSCSGTPPLHSAASHSPRSTQLHLAGDQQEPLYMNEGVELLREVEDSVPSPQSPPPLPSDPPPPRPPKKDKSYQPEDDANEVEDYSSPNVKTGTKSILKNTKEDKYTEEVNRIHEEINHDDGGEGDHSIAHRIGSADGSQTGAVITSESKKSNIGAGNQKSSSKGKSVFGDGNIFEELTRKIKSKRQRSQKQHRDKEKAVERDKSAPNVTVIEISNPQPLEP
ncbi:PREDICTED: uncharacterized protein LOC106811774 [Priapulus caudatus]|uniref:Uncharacterized protein LOC106811774 n=1 Tax=Priapulus caudatus TaxID=37621 RepID=A0ABM1EFK4_PRICU|nr:PREDICTED: uncharacterized protein LOC106811774 [Priapulus caudatus]